ncbi:MAG TPA: DUF72 domain-containing protein [Candidatus Acidoferrales bacterium]|nr:DUF72 domain-containing protein [Candidatus Acidoferrales bacterium]
MKRQAQARNGCLRRSGNSMAHAGKVWIGISGWTYPPWRGVFYPKGLPHKKELSYAAATFNSVEINGTFYSLQRASSFAEWARATPDDFCFALKGSQFITHMKRLKDVKRPLANFFASGMLRLGKNLGPIVWQFSRNFPFDEALFADFFGLLPEDTEQAAVLARLHDQRLKTRAWMKVDVKRKLRHAVEVRNESFRSQRFIELLRRNNVALACSDGAGLPHFMEVTADFVYCRLHGAQELYASGYSDGELSVWAQRVEAWSRGEESSEPGRVGKSNTTKHKKRDVYVYFDNDSKVRAPFDAMKLRELLTEMREQKPRAEIGAGANTRP